MPRGNTFFAVVLMILSYARRVSTSWRLFAWYAPQRSNELFEVTGAFGCLRF